MASNGSNRADHVDENDGNGNFSEDNIPVSCNQRKNILIPIFIPMREIMHSMGPVGSP